MLRYYFTSLFSLAAFTTYAQEVISSGGGTFTSSDSGSLSFTIGELAINSYLAEEQLLTEGFQQPKLNSTPVIHIPKYDFALTVFPNPAGRILRIKIENHPIERTIGINIIDPLGRVLRFLRIDSDQTEIDISNLAMGFYILKTIIDGEPGPGIKIQKI